jgi:hypothetical protein
MNNKRILFSLKKVADLNAPFQQVGRQTSEDKQLNENVEFAKEMIG